MLVDVNEVERCLRYFKAINDARLEDIVWVRGDEKLTADPALIEEFCLIGLGNRDFPAVAGWLPEGVGIRVATLRITQTSNSNSTTQPV